MVFNLTWIWIKSTESISWVKEKGALVKWERAEGDGHVKWRKKPKKWVGGGEASSDYSAVGSVTIFFFWNITVEEKIPERGACENSGWMKDLYRYRKEQFPERASENKSNKAENPMTKVQLGAEVLRWEKIGSVETYS